MASNPPMQPEVTILINADSIYQDSIVEISLIGDISFSAHINGEIIITKLGKKNPENLNYIQSEEKDGRYAIYVEVIGWFKERKVTSTSEDGPHNRYGMRFYPFISCFLSGSINIKKCLISSLTLNLPERFRLIWYGAQVTNPNGDKSRLNHSKGADRSKYVFIWHDQKVSSGEYKLNVPIRLGGTELLRLTNFPI
jgi:hypothetical protein